MTTQTEKCFLCAEYVNQLDEHIQQHKDTLKAFRELEQASKLQNGSVILENCYNKKNEFTGVKKHGSEKLQKENNTHQDKTGNDKKWLLDFSEISTQANLIKTPEPYIKKSFETLGFETLTSIEFQARVSSD